MSIQTNRRRFVGALSLAAAGAVAGVARYPGGAYDQLTGAAPATDQTLRIVTQELPSTLGPQLGGLRPMLENTFLPAFITDQNLDLQPGVCTEWTVSDDGLTYTLKLDPAARFSDGTKVTAADLKFSYDYLTRPETGSWAPPYVTLFIDGYQEVLDGTAEEMRGLTVVDEETLQVTLSEPFTAFIFMLANHLAGIVKRDNVLEGGDTWDDNPVCCGPYRVESWNRDTGEVSWVPNEGWWRASPTIQRVTHRRVEDPNTHLLMWDNDEMDLFRPSPVVVAQLLLGPQADQLHLNPYSGVYLFCPKVPRPPMDDVNVRRALLKALDMGTIVEAVFGGGQDPAYDVYSWSVDGYVPPEPYFDPEGARAALAASTYGAAENVPPITIIEDAPEFLRVAEAMRQMWQDNLGIEANVVRVLEATDPANETAHYTFTASGNVIADAAHIGTDLGLSSGIFMSMFLETEDDEIDRLVIEANQLPFDQQERRIELYREVNRLLMDRAYYIPVIQSKVHYAVKPWVINLATNNDLSLYTIPEMYIAEH